MQASRRWFIIKTIWDFCLNNLILNILNKLLEAPDCNRGMDAQRSNKMTSTLKKTRTFNYSLVISVSKLIFLSLFRVNESIWKCKSYGKMQICVLCLCHGIWLVLNTVEHKLCIMFLSHTPVKLCVLFCWMFSALSCNFAILVQNSIVVSAPSDLNLMWHYTFHLPPTT